jgi:hypothetical protein
MLKDLTIYVYEHGPIQTKNLSKKKDTLKDRTIYVYDTAQVQILESLCVVKKSPTHV